jgi:hypothetical protein
MPSNKYIHVSQNFNIAKLNFIDEFHLSKKANYTYLRTFLLKTRAIYRDISSRKFAMYSQTFGGRDVLL